MSENKRSDRIKEAVKYQEMAVLALLGESGAQHAKAIGRELKAMLYECAAEVINKETKAAKKDMKSGASNEKVIKVEIR